MADGGHDGADRNVQVSRGLRGCVREANRWPSDNPTAAMPGGLPQLSGYVVVSVVLVRTSKHARTSSLPASSTSRWVVNDLELPSTLAA